MRLRQSSVERTAGLFERKEDRRFGGGKRTIDHISVGVSNIPNRNGCAADVGPHNCMSVVARRRHAEAEVYCGETLQPLRDAHLSRSTRIDMCRLARTQRSELCGPQPSTWQHCEMSSEVVGHARSLSIFFEHAKHRPTQTNCALSRVSSSEHPIINT